MKRKNISNVSQEKKCTIFLTQLFKQHFKKIDLPKTYSLEQINKQFLASFPNLFFFKSIAIISCTKAQDPQLASCFINPNETLQIKEKLYESLYNNSKNFDHNNEIINCIGSVINNLPSTFFITQYVSLIKCFTKKMAKESATLCNLLVLFPSNYEELYSTINTKMNLADLPENPVYFYSRSRYNENILNFGKNSEKKKGPEKESLIGNELDKLKQDNTNKDKEIIKLHSEIENIKDLIINMKNDLNLERAQKDITINQLKTKINKLESDNIKLKTDISSIGIKLQNTEYSLFQIQLRDIINAFIEEIKWSFGLQSEGLDKMIDELKIILDDMVGEKTSDNNNSGVKVILDIIRNCKNTKLQGNNRGHYINNIGFDEKILPEDIRALYIKYKQKNNNLIKDCDSVALILSVNEINNASEDNEKTKKKYKLFNDIFSISKKSIDERKKKIKSLIINYV